MTCTQIILKFQYTCYCSPRDALLYCIAGTWWKPEAQEKHLPSHGKHWTGRTTTSSSVLCSLWLYYSLQPHTEATPAKKKDGIQFGSLVSVNPAAWGVARVIQGTLPSADRPQNPLCWTQHFKRQPGWTKACSWRMRNERLKTNSFGMSSSKFIHTSQAHQLKSNIHVYADNTWKHKASVCFLAFWLKWCEVSAALKIVFTGHVEPNLTVRFEAYFTV